MDEQYAKLIEEQDEYFTAVHNGMCPTCEGHNTSETYQSGVCDARWCYDCEQEFITEY